jgi:hypothetical protein
MCAGGTDARQVQLVQELSATSGLRQSRVATINYGTAWVLFEQALNPPTRGLLSILSPRRTARDVAAYMEQLYVDRFCSIRAQLVYKKSRKFALCPTTIDRYGLGMHCGHDPGFVGIYARKILLKGDVLEYEYRIVAVTDHPRHLVFETKRQTLTVNG